MIQAQATRFGVFHVIPPEHRDTPVKAAASGAFAGGVSVLLFQGIDVGTLSLLFLCIFLGHYKIF